MAPKPIDDEWIGKRGIYVSDLEERGWGPQHSIQPTTGLINAVNTFQYYIQH